MNFLAARSLPHSFLVFSQRQFNNTHCSKLLPRIFFSNIGFHSSANGHLRQKKCILCLSMSLLRTQLHNNKHLRTIHRRFSGYPYRNTTGTQPNASRKRLLYAVYMSFAIGGVLLTLIILREVNKVRRRVNGVEEVTESNCGRRGLIIKYKDVALPAMVEQVLVKLETFSCREDDVWVVSYPRSGITWAQQLVYLIHTLDFHKAENMNVEQRFPYFEFYLDRIDSATEQIQSSPRFIKTHLPLRLLPEEISEKNPKIIYIARNPKDVVVSYYHFIKMLRPLTRYKGDFTSFFDAFLYGRAPYSPWWRHVQEFWEIKDKPNVLFITYEDLQEDLEGSINYIADFLEKKLSDSQVKQIADDCMFENMKKNNSVNYSWWDDMGYRDKKSSEFFREGKVGGWKNHLTSEMNKQMDMMIALKFGGSGLFFKYDDNSIVSNDKNVVLESGTAVTDVGS